MDKAVNGTGHKRALIPSGLDHSKSPRLLLLFVFWLLLAGAGFSMLLCYGNTPGATEKPIAGWPAGSTFHRSPGRFQFVMFIHPECSCSRASLSELAQFVAHSGNRADVLAVFMEPAEKAREWRDSDLWRSASGLKGVTAVRDSDGRETGLFHAAVSGESFLYDPDGTLRFHGGITGARGHEGDNAGLFAVEDIVNKGFSAVGSTPVFGCALCARSVPAAK